MTTIKVGDTFKDGMGRPVRIICTDAKHNDGPIVGMVTGLVGGEMVEIYDLDGRTRDNYGKRSLVLPVAHIRLDSAVAAVRQAHSNWDGCATVPLVERIILLLRRLDQHMVAPD